MSSLPLLSPSPGAGPALAAKYIPLRGIVSVFYLGGKMHSIQRDCLCFLLEGQNAFHSKGLSLFSTWGARHGFTILYPHAAVSLAPELAERTLQVVERPLTSNKLSFCMKINQGFGKYLERALLISRSPSSSSCRTQPGDGSSKNVFKSVFSTFHSGMEMRITVLWVLLSRFADLCR